jgi:D-alanine-D-alanine ligase-like ATP-grasp enzyme
VEEYIPGREFTVPVLNGKAIGVIEVILQSASLLNYQAKMGEIELDEIVDPPIPEELK